MSSPLVAEPTVCTAAGSALAGTGAAFPGWLVLVAALAVIGGAALVLVRRRAAIALVLVLVGTLLLAPAGAPSAQAADVEYSTGCTLILVENVTFTGEAAAMLPGDSVVALSAVVTNRYRGPISLDGAAELGGTVLAGAATTSLAFDGGPGPVTVPDGDSVLVTVTVSLPANATDALQGVSAGLTLVLTATEQ